jgi:hypothetical protein
MREMVEVEQNGIIYSLPQWQIAILFLETLGITKERERNTHAWQLPATVK